MYAAARDLRKSIGSILDFSASINPLGPSPKAVRLLGRNVQLIAHYPDPDCVSLKRAIARRWRMTPDRIVVGNGSTELIDLLPRALSFRSTLIVGPTYSEYANAVGRAGGRVTTLLAKKEEQYRPPLEEVLRRMATHRRRGAGIDSIVLCHPNSPTGRPCRPHDLRALFAAAESAEVWVVVDESFIEYCHSLTCMPDQHRYSRLIILRSFTKFYGLPGLRIGYSVSSPTVAASLRRHQPPWSVNMLGQRAAEAAFADRAHARRCLTYVDRERARLAAQLSSLDGLTVNPSSANFILMELPRPFLAAAVVTDLRRHGMLVRDCSSLQGCTSRMIRAAVRMKRDNDRLVAALAAILRP